MCEQQMPEFNNYNTLDYAMHRHDIERIEVVIDHHEANRKMLEGWVLLSIVMRSEGITHGGEPVQLQYEVYIMGVPRAKFCTYSFQDEHPKRMRKEWNHQRKEWECRWCTEHRAYLENEDIDGAGLSCF